MTHIDRYLEHVPHNEADAAGFKDIWKIADIGAPGTARVVLDQMARDGKINKRIVPLRGTVTRALYFRGKENDAK